MCPWDTRPALWAIVAVLNFVPYTPRRGVMSEVLHSFYEVSMFLYHYTVDDIVLLHRFIERMQ